MSHGGLEAFESLRIGSITPSVVCERTGSGSASTIPLRGNGGGGIGKAVEAGDRHARRAQSGNPSR